MPTGTEVHSGSGGLLGLIFGMIPDNLFTPFTTGNTVQMLIIGVILAVAMLAAKEDAKGLANIIGQINSIVLIVLGVIAKLIGIYLFTNIVYNIVGGDIQTLIIAAKLFATNLIGFTLALILHTIYVSAAYKISPKLLWKKVLPPVMIAFTTCSSSAAYLRNRQVCNEELGIDEKTVDLALPFGQIMYKIGDVIFYSASSLWLLESLKLTQRPTYLISLVFLCIILAIATPPVPGGATASLTIMMAFWGGESPELMGLLIAVQVVVDCFVTGVNIFCIDCATVAASERLNTIDNDILKSEN